MLGQGLIQDFLGGRGKVIKIVRDIYVAFCGLQSWPWGGCGKGTLPLGGIAQFDAVVALWCKGATVCPPLNHLYSGVRV